MLARPKALVGCKAVALRVGLLTVPTTVLMALLLEGLTRCALHVSDVPITRFDHLLGNHYLPNQEGRYITGPGPEINAAFRINANGWNSPRDYVLPKPAGLFRMGVIGDSYVEALQVDHDMSYPYLAERALNREGLGVEVEARTYGHSGASLAQYLGVLRHAVAGATPDLVVVNVVHNDFLESLRGHGRVDYWSLQFEGSEPKEVPPVPRSGMLLKVVLARSALVRYLVVNQQCLVKLRALRRARSAGRGRYEANVDVAGVGGSVDEGQLAGLATYVLSEMRRVTDSLGARLLCMIDANRVAIYEGRDPRATEVHRLNRALLRAGRQLGVPVIDLTDVFEARWSVDRRRFEWQSDAHWDDYGHRVVAQALAEWILQNPELLGLRGPGTTGPAPGTTPRH